MMIQSILFSFLFLLKHVFATHTNDDDDADIFNHNQNISPFYQWSLVAIFGGIGVMVLLYLIIIVTKNKRR